MRRIHIESTAISINGFTAPFGKRHNRAVRRLVGSLAIRRQAYATMPVAPIVRQHWPASLSTEASCWKWLRTGKKLAKERELELAKEEGMQ